MSAAEVLSMAKAEGVALVLTGDRLTWRADHQPPVDLLSGIKAHRLEIIAALGAANDPQTEQAADQPQHFILTAVTASPEWRQARDQYHNHLMPCRACYAPTGRYCAAGADLRTTYNSTPMERVQ
ncbi:hypothetical protein [Pseudomonas paeninsulae]|uniref:hypothetical protein n=1 Tax=Pseudomonas paeninsulae TaxID=3110772 RepID=UPI002D77F16C|nr:hypothetical protein [Pseudomonas sp. IT1137]